MPSRGVPGASQLQPPGFPCVNNVLAVETKNGATKRHIHKDTYITNPAATYALDRSWQTPSGDLLTCVPTTVKKLGVPSP